MKSGTARKVQDLRPSVADQQQVNKGEKRPHRQKPSIVPAVHSAEPGEHQQGRESLPELQTGLWRKLCWVTQSATVSPDLCSEVLNRGIMMLIKMFLILTTSDIISAGPGAVDVTFCSGQSRICASSSKTAVRNEQELSLCCLLM